MSGLTLEQFENYDVSSLNKIQLKEFIHAFYNVNRIRYDFINIRRWNLSKWNVSRVTDFTGLFSYCQFLVELDLTGWNVPTNYENMFIGCQLLKEIKGVDEWLHVVDSERLFKGCPMIKCSELFSSLH